MALGNDRKGWDTALTLEALGAAGVALWTWSPTEDRPKFSGASRRLGRLTRSRLASSLSAGRRDPGTASPLAMSARIWSAIWR